MDQQNVIFLGCLTLALAISAFILWGPSPRPRKKKGQIVGLANLGSTCFLNTLLQALASCALFMQWLMQQKHEENSLTSSLSQVLWILNGEGKGEVHAPIEVLSALKRHGWVVPAGEQDAHELFHVIVSTLQDENKKLVKVGSLSDALPASDTLSQTSDILDDNSDVHTDETVQNGNSELNCPEVLMSKNEKEGELAKGDSRSNKERPVPEEIFCGDGSMVVNKAGKIMEGDSLTQSSSDKFYSLSDATGKEVKYCGDMEESTLKLQLGTTNDETLESSPVLKRNASPESAREKSVNYARGCFDRATGRSVSMPRPEAPPFQGLLTSTLQCSTCGYYSSQHYDTFDSLSLPLGDNAHLKVLKLQDLLRRFVKTEVIPDVECEKCCKKTTAFKTMNFGKLPACLCLHIARTTWQTCSHTPTKRDDFIDFPEYLPMDEYTVSARLKKSASVNSLQATNSGDGTFAPEPYKHMYRLKSVIVHFGDVTSGHFLTYRRGALNSMQRHRIGKMAGACKDSRRWYLTSDDNVKVSTLCEAMESLAYMLFYEKCASDDPSTDDDSDNQMKHQQQLLEG